MTVPRFLAVLWDELGLLLHLCYETRCEQLNPSSAVAAYDFTASVYGIRRYLGCGQDRRVKAGGREETATSSQNYLGHRTSPGDSQLHALCECTLRKFRSPDEAVGHSTTRCFVSLAGSLLLTTSSWCSPHTCVSVVELTFSCASLQLTVVACHGWAASASSTSSAGSIRNVKNARWHFHILLIVVGE